MKEPIAVKYTNWKGESAIRKIVPIKIWFGDTPYHPEQQYLLRARDENGKIKDFALKDCDFQVRT